MIVGRDGKLADSWLRQGCAETTSSGCGDFTFVADGLEVKGSPLLGELGFSVARRKQSEFDAFFVDRKIARRLEDQFLNRLEADEIFDSFIDLDRIGRDFDLRGNLSRFFAAAAGSICHENGVWKQAAKMKLGRSIGVGSVPLILLPVKPLSQWSG